MIEKLKTYFKKLDANQQKILHELHLANLQSKELEWAHIYHDSIRGKKWLEELPIHVGRWAGNYSFFYVLHRILSDYQPNKILELGLGESTKVVSAYLENELHTSTHTVIEHNEEWVHAFHKKFKLSPKSNIEVCPLQTKIINQHEVIGYEGFDTKTTDDFDLYLIDGPFGSERFSRYDIISMVEKFEPDKEFIILFDDTNRPGEEETCQKIMSILKEKNIAHHSFKYEGNKASTVIASNAYQYAISF